MNFYVYENWRAESKAVIHRGGCGNCNYGEGCHDNKHGNRNGVWHGPFTSLQDAIQSARGTGRSIKQHSCV